MRLYRILFGKSWPGTFFALLASAALGQEPQPATSATPFEETIKPTFETQKMARTYVLDIPAPRGQITDRNGAPLAQNKLSYNLAINFPDAARFFQCASQCLCARENQDGRKITRP